MKICWDNLNKLRYDSIVNCWRDKKHIRYIYKERCKNCGEPFLARTDHIKRGAGLWCFQLCYLLDKDVISKRAANISGENSPMKRPEVVAKISGENSAAKKPEVRKKMSLSHSGEKGYWYGKTGKKFHGWKGGYGAKNIAYFDTYASRLDYAEKIRRDPLDKNILQVKCLECNKWFTPNLSNVRNRIYALEGKTQGEHRFYCSDTCKILCPIYRTSKYRKFEKPNKQRLDQTEWRKMVLERDNYECQICGAKDVPLIAHHYEGIEQNQIESADIDMGITLCNKCDKFVHAQIGCRNIDLQKKCIEVTNG